MQRALVWWGLIAIPNMKRGMKEVADLSSLDHAVQSAKIEGVAITLSPMKKAGTRECNLSLSLHSSTARRLSTSRALSLLRFSSVILSLCFLYLKVARHLTPSWASCYIVHINYVGSWKWVEHVSVSVLTLTAFLTLVALHNSVTFLSVTETQTYIYAPLPILEIACTIIALR